MSRLCPEAGQHGHVDQEWHSKLDSRKHHDDDEGNSDVDNSTATHVLLHSAENDGDEDHVQV